MGHGALNSGVSSSSGQLFVYLPIRARARNSAYWSLRMVHLAHQVQQGPDPYVSGPFSLVVDPAQLASYADRAGSVGSGTVKRLLRLFGINEEFAIASAAL